MNTKVKHIGNGLHTVTDRQGQRVVIDGQSAFPRPQAYRIAKSLDDDAATK